MLHKPKGAWKRATHSDLYLGDMHHCRWRKGQLEEGMMAEIRMEISGLRVIIIKHIRSSGNVGGGSRVWGQGEPYLCPACLVMELGQGPEALAMYPPADQAQPPLRHNLGILAIQWKPQSQPQPSFGTGDESNRYSNGGFGRISAVEPGTAHPSLPALNGLCP